MPWAGGDAVQPGVRPLRLYEHLLLLWGMRLRVVSNRGRGQGPLSSLVGTLTLVASGLGVSAALFKLFSHPAIAGAPLLEMFLFQLLGFLVAVMWIMWPIVTAGVDDSSELSRFATLPIHPVRLFLASSLGALVDPRALVFYPVLAAAALGFAHSHHVRLDVLGLILGTGTFALFNVAWGRVGLTAMLNVLRHRRSAEIVGGGLILALFCCSLVPPLDTSWLTASVQGGKVDVDQLNVEVIEAAVLVFSAVPSGVWALSFLMPYRHAWLRTGTLDVYLFSYAAIGFAIAFALLLRFYATTARAGVRESVGKVGNPFRGPSVFGVLVERELRDLLHNPKVRMLAALPFFLTILLKLVQARDVIRIVGGAHTDVWIIAVLCTYGGVVLAANFAQNAFGYDGPGLTLLFAAPVPLRQVLLAKNIVHGASSLLLGLLLLAFYSVYVHLPSGPEVVVAAATLLLQVVLILTVGNVLSVLAPRKFHAGLQRRDRVPPLTTFGGIVAAGIALAPLRWTLLQNRDQPVEMAAALAMLGSVVVALAIYAASLEPALALLDARREEVLRAITRE